MITSGTSLFCESAAVDSDRLAVADEALCFFDCIVEVVGTDGLGVLNFAVGADDNDVPFILAAVEPGRGSAATVC